MTTEQFIASLVSSLAWPLAAVVIVLIFRRQIRGLLAGGVKRLRAGPLELEWDRTLSAAEIELDQPDIPGPGAVRVAGGVAEELAGVIERSPTAAVMEAHSRVERALRSVIEQKAPGTAPQAGAAALARRARELGLINDETVRAIEGITLLRNLAAHGRAGDVGTERAREYLALADAVLYAIQRAPAISG